jgi:hypothetical protein
MSYLARYTPSEVDYLLSIYDLQKFPRDEANKHLEFLSMLCDLMQISIFTGGFYQTNAKENDRWVIKWELSKQGWFAIAERHPLFDGFTETLYKYSPHDAWADVPDSTKGKLPRFIKIGIRMKGRPVFYLIREIDPNTFPKDKKGFVKTAWQNYPLAMSEQSLRMKLLRNVMGKFLHPAYPVLNVPAQHITVPAETAKALALSQTATAPEKVALQPATAQKSQVPWEEELETDWDSEMQIILDKIQQSNHLTLDAFRDLKRIARSKWEQEGSIACLDYLKKALDKVERTQALANLKSRTDARMPPESDLTESEQLLATPLLTPEMQSLLDTLEASTDCLNAEQFQTIKQTTLTKLSNQDATGALAYLNKALERVHEKRNPAPTPAPPSQDEYADKLGRIHNILLFMQAKSVEWIPDTDKSNYIIWMKVCSALMNELEPEDACNFAKEMYPSCLNPDNFQSNFDKMYDEKVSKGEAWGGFNTRWNSLMKVAREQLGYDPSWKPTDDDLAKIKAKKASQTPKLTPDDVRFQQEIKDKIAGMNDEAKLVAYWDSLDRKHHQNNALKKYYMDKRQQLKNALRA